MTLMTRPDCGWAAAVAAHLLLTACGGSSPALQPVDPRAVLQAHISHGIGESPFESPLVSDPTAAAMIVDARQCASPEELRKLATDDARGESLLERLRSDGLIAVRDGRACSTFPILIHGQQAAYAKLTRAVAEEALQGLSSDLDTLAAMVDERGWKEWGYHFLWSQLFDSQFVWTEMMQRKLVPPLGNLVGWVVYPDHPFRSGTNYYPDDQLRDHWLMVTWRAEAANSLGLVGGNWEAIYGIALEGREMSDGERARFADLNLVDDQGRLQIPVLEAGDPLLELLKSISVRYVDFLERRMPVDSLTVLSGVGRQHTFAMAYHDVSWWIVADLVGSGRIEVPPGLKPDLGGGQRSMRGVAGIAPVHQPFADLIRTAIESQH